MDFKEEIYYSPQRHLQGPFKVQTPGVLFPPWDKEPVSRIRDTRANISHTRGFLLLDICHKCTIANVRALAVLHFRLKGKIVKKVLVIVPFHRVKSLGVHIKIFQQDVDLVLFLTFAKIVPKDRSLIFQTNFFLGTRAFTFSTCIIINGIVIGSIQYAI